MTGLSDTAAPMLRGDVHQIINLMSGPAGFVCVYASPTIVGRGADG